MEWKKGNTFGTTAFTSYGLFWLTLVGLVLLPKSEEYAGFATASFPFAAYLFMWGLFTLYMFIGTLKATRALQIVFLTLTILSSCLQLETIWAVRKFLKLLDMKGLLQGFQQFMLPWVRY